MVHRAITNLLGISVFAIARGLLAGKHQRGVYVIGISAAFVAAGGAAEKLIGDTDYVRAGEAIAGGVLIANGLAIGLWVSGVPHISLIAAVAILLAGVLLLLVGAIMQAVAEYIEDVYSLWAIYSPGGKACEYLLRGGQVREASNLGQQSPRGWSANNMIKASSTVPRLPRP